MASRPSSKKATELVHEALRLQRAGDSQEALALFRRVVVLEPTNGIALGMLGAHALASAEHERASSYFERAVRFSPPNAALQSNLGEAYRRLGRREEAVAALRRAVLLAPELAEAHYNLALTLDQLGRRREATLALEAALALKPDLPHGVTLLLEMLRDEASYAAALDVYAKYSGLVAMSAELEAAVANVFADIFRLDEAIEHFERGLLMAPSSAGLRADYGAALAELGDIPRAVEQLRKAIELDPKHVQAHGALVYLLAFDERSTPKAIHDEAKRFAHQHTASVDRHVQHSNTRDAQRRLRVGYLSPDFRLHPISLFIPSVLEHHDRTRVEVFCYSNGRRGDDITARIRGAVDGWRDISGLDDEAAARLIQGDRIDVLVDLTMHSAGNRLLMLARRPAPVQLCWLAYPGTTGIPEIQYRLTDPHLDPPGTGDADYSERSVRMPETFWCYAPLSLEPEVNPLPAIATGHVTFGCLNSFKKVSDAALELWARVLSAVPGARMLLVAPEGSAWVRAERAFAAAGIARDRVERVAHAPREEYLKTFHRIDCCLDTTPYAGGTVSCDAYWMGVPVVTLAGQTVASRSGASLARNLDLPELVTLTPDDYVSRAAAVASDLGRLAQLRGELRGRMQRSALMDTTRFTRHLEAAYRDLWARWCGEP